MKSNYDHTAAALHAEIGKMHIGARGGSARAADPGDAETPPKAATDKLFLIAIVEQTRCGEVRARSAAEAIQKLTRTPGDNPYELGHHDAFMRLAVGKKLALVVEHPARKFSVHRQAEIPGTEEAGSE